MNDWIRGCFISLASHIISAVMFAAIYFGLLYVIGAPILALIGFFYYFPQLLVSVALLKLFNHVAHLSGSIMRICVVLVISIIVISLFGIGGFIVTPNGLRDCTMAFVYSGLASGTVITMLSLFVTVNSNKLKDHEEERPLPPDEPSR